MMLFLCGVPDFASTKQYRENGSFVDPDLSVGLYLCGFSRYCSDMHNY